MRRRCLQFICCTLCLVACARLSAQTRDRAAIEIHYKRGEEALRTKRYTEAAAEFRAILRIDPANASAHANLGIALFQGKVYAGAAEQFRAALRLQPGLWNAEALLGMSEFRLGKDEQARVDLNASFRQLDDAKLKSEAGMDLITLCYQSKNLGPCVDVLQDLLQVRPAAPGTLYAAYRLYTDLATRSLSELVQSDPDSAEVHEVLGEALASHDDYPGAIAQYRKALEIAPRLAGAHYQLGLMILSNSQTVAALQEAGQQFNQSLIEDPTDAHSEYMLGEVEWLQLKPKRALQYYVRALKLQPDLVDAHIAAGKALTRLGEPAQALAQLQDAVRLDPRNEVAHYRLAQAYRRLDRTLDADREDAIFQKLRDSHEPVRALYQEVEQQPILHQTIEAPHR